MPDDELLSLYLFGYQQSNLCITRSHLFEGLKWHSKMNGANMCQPQNDGKRLASGEQVDQKVRNSVPFISNPGILQPAFGVLPGAAIWRFMLTGQIECLEVDPMREMGRSSICKLKPKRITSMVSGSSLYKIKISIDKLDARNGKRFARTALNR